MNYRYLRTYLEDRESEWPCGFSPLTACMEANIDEAPARNVRRSWLAVESSLRVLEQGFDHGRRPLVTCTMLFSAVPVTTTFRSGFLPKDLGSKQFGLARVPVASPVAGLSLHYSSKKHKTTTRTYVSERPEQLKKHSNFPQDYGAALVLKAHLARHLPRFGCLHAAELPARQHPLGS